jgi:predicted RNase H-like HicB family nuclease
LAHELLDLSDRLEAQITTAQNATVLYWFRTQRDSILKQFKVIVEEHSDGYVAYPIDLKGVIVGEGDTHEDALADVKSAIGFHIETFGADILETEQPVLEAFIAETGIAL